MMVSTEDLMQKFSGWLKEAAAHPHIKEPTAMCLATVAGGIPSARIVLLKHYDRDGFVFYTNMQSRKSGELEKDQHAALCFHWMPLQKQVRVEGFASEVSAAEADAYFATRLRESQIGAWASEQSRVLQSHEVLVQRAVEVAKRFEGKAVPRPPFWSGWRIRPETMEFWQEGAHRLHHRECYTRKPDGGWTMNLLYP